MCFTSSANSPPLSPTDFHVLLTDKPLVWYLTNYIVNLCRDVEEAISPEHGERA